MKCLKRFLIVTLKSLDPDHVSFTNDIDQFSVVKNQIGRRDFESRFGRAFRDVQFISKTF